MPIGPLIGAGLDIIGGVVNANNQREMNDQNWIRQAQMYDQQRKDALADRDYNNVYNSPAEQMKRLKAAGLNPNLVYGNGGVAQSSSQMPRGSSPGGPTGIAPRIDLSSIGQAFMQTYQMGLMSAQASALGARQALDMEKTKTQEQLTSLTAGKSILTNANVPYASSLAASAAGILEAKKHEQVQKANLVWKQVEFLTDSYGYRLDKALQDTLIQQNIMKLQDQQLKQVEQKMQSEAFRQEVLKFQARMAQANINPNQPAWMQGLMLLFKKFGINIFDL